MTKLLRTYGTHAALLGVLLVPMRLAYAAPENFKALVNQLVGLIDLATIALFSLAIVFFFWTVIVQMWGYDGGSAEQKKKLQETLFWGVLVIFIMVSIWGIIEILQQTLSRGLV
ncbi:hypothetical protein CL652_00285 [bacterium]|nr:hypothetical protein [bacterium]|tara:strand:+ start:8233 stop:8574 length:342 start_codon:yes stop_codon:yes gene_type:complete